MGLSSSEVLNFVVLGTGIIFDCFSSSVKKIKNTIMSNMGNNRYDIRMIRMNEVRWPKKAYNFNR